MRKTKKIYLISETGAIHTNSLQGAAAAEALGYRRCTRKEYQAQLRRMRANDVRAIVVGRE